MLVGLSVVFNTVEQKSEREMRAQGRAGLCELTVNIEKEFGF